MQNIPPTMQSVKTEYEAFIQHHFSVFSEFTKLMDQHKMYVNICINNYISHMQYLKMHFLPLQDPFLL